jgi:hypothetical protein
MPNAVNPVQKMGRIYFRGLTSTTDDNESDLQWQSQLPLFRLYDYCTCTVTSVKSGCSTEALALHCSNNPLIAKIASSHTSLLLFLLKSEYSGKSITWKEDVPQ